MSADLDPRPSEEGAEPERIAGRRNLAFTSVLSVGLAVVRGAGAEDVGTIALDSVASLAGLIGLFQIVNSFWRIRCQHWCSAVGARLLLVPELFIGVLLTAVGVEGAIGDPITSIAVIPVLTVSCVSYLPIEHAIAEKIKVANKRSGTERFEDTRPLAGLGSDLTVRDTLAEWRIHGFAGWFTSLFRSEDVAEPVSVARLSTTRVRLAQFLSVLATVSIGTTTASAVGGKVDAARSNHPDPPATQQDQGPKDEPKTSTEPAPTPAPKSPPPATTPVATPAPTVQEKGWAEACGKTPLPGRVPPGDRVPEWARQGLYDAFLAEGGPGGAQAGCTIGPVNKLNDDYYWQAGFDPVTFDLLSIAVAARSHAPMIFLAPAAARVEASIKLGVAVTGQDRQDVGGGDLYLVDLPGGTSALVRESKSVAGAPTIAAPYFELPPAVAERWDEAMRWFATWLWPKSTAIAVDGTQEFAFASPNDRVRVIIEYDPAHGTAWRADFGPGTARRATGRRIAMASLLDVPHP